MSLCNMPNASCDRVGRGCNYWRMLETLLSSMSHRNVRIQSASYTHTKIINVSRLNRKMRTAKIHRKTFVVSKLTPDESRQPPTLQSITRRDWVSCCWKNLGAEAGRGQSALSTYLQSVFVERTLAGEAVVLAKGVGIIDPKLFATAFWRYFIAVYKCRLQFLADNNPSNRINLQRSGLAWRAL